MKIAGLVLAILINIAFSPAASFSEQDATAQEIYSMRGSIVDVDWAGSKIVLRCSVDSSYDEMTFEVNDDTVITRGDEKWEFSNIQSGDRVKIQYFNRQFGWPLAVSIAIDI